MNGGLIDVKLMGNQLFSPLRGLFSFSVLCGTSLE